MNRGPGSLRLRIVAVFGLLIVSIAGFTAVFLPSKIEEQLRIATEQRATMLAQVIANAVEPAIEFDDPEHARATLGWLEALGDARFAVVTNGRTQIADWNGRRAPPDLAPEVARIQLAYVDDQLVVSAPVVEKGAGRAAVHLGFSLEHLAAERDRARNTVEIAALVMLVVGGAACFVFATILVRPIRRLTLTARKIARGDAPPVLAPQPGTGEVSQMTTAISVMLDRLNQVNAQLVDASRMAGMAEVATGVLHNVGNVLTSVNVAVGMLGERLDVGPIERLTRSAALLDEARKSGESARLDAAMKLVTGVTAKIARDHTAAGEELATLRRHIDHVARIVLTQNRYAKTVSVTEAVSVAALVDEAVELGCSEAARKDIAISRVIECDGAVPLDRHRVLQILVNLVSNARDAVLAGASAKTIDICATRVDGELRIDVCDSGVGFDLDDGSKIFQAGFTTKPHGHGYGLHSSGIAAQQLGGTLRCASPGKGRGATFSLCIPITDKGGTHA